MDYTPIYVVIEFFVRRVINITAICVPPEYTMSGKGGENMILQDQPLGNLIPTMQSPINERRAQHVLPHDLLEEASAAHEVLLKAKTVFPFVIFPDTISVDRVKVTITKRYFLAHSETSIQIEDILDVQSSCGPLFGTVKLRTRFFAERSLSIRYLWRNEAQKLKSLLQGYIIARRKEIDTLQFPRQQLLPMLMQLGSDYSGEPSIL